MVFCLGFLPGEGAFPCISLQSLEDASPPAHPMPAPACLHMPGVVSPQGTRGQGLTWPRCPGAGKTIPTASRCQMWGRLPRKEQVGTGEVMAGMGGKRTAVTAPEVALLSQHPVPEPQTAIRSVSWRANVMVGPRGRFEVRRFPTQHPWSLRRVAGAGGSWRVVRRAASTQPSCVPPAAEPGRNNPQMRHKLLSRDGSADGGLICCSSCYIYLGDAAVQPRCAWQLSRENLPQSLGMAR